MVRFRAGELCRVSLARNVEAFPGDEGARRARGLDQDGEAFVWGKFGRASVVFMSGGWDVCGFSAFRAGGFACCERVGFRANFVVRPTTKNYAGP